jgi:hypothetical protein
VTLPGNVLQMTGDPATLLDPSKLPVDPNTCEPVYPQGYLRVNTIFEVAKEDTEPLVAFSIDDVGMLIWLQYRRPEQDRRARRGQPAGP